MKDYKHLLPNKLILGDAEVDAVYAEIKKPTQCFPDDNPMGCGRNCKRFFMSHNHVMSLALYSPQPMDGVICAYAVSCGSEIHSMKFVLAPKETPTQLIQKITPKLIQTFVEMAEAEEKESHG